MSIKSQPRNLAFLLTEAPGNLSSDTLTLAADQGKLEPGSVLGKVTASDEYVLSPNAETAGKEGAEVANAILCYTQDTTGAAAPAVLAITDLAEVKADMLVFDASVDDDAKKQAKFEQLRATHIKVR